MIYNKKLICQLVCALCFSFGACKKDNAFEIKNLNGGKITVVGHAGSGMSSAENPVKEDTYTSAKNALELFGASGVELDVHMSYDSIFFLLHDQVLDVSTNLKGCVYDYNSSELDKCYYNFTSEKLTQLETCLQHFSDYPVKPVVFIDTRLYAPCNADNYEVFTNQFVNAIYNLIDKYNAYDWVYVESRDPAFLQKIKNKSTQIKLFIDGFISSELDVAVNMDLVGIVVEDAFITKEEIELAHSKNIMVVTYGALNKKETIEAIKKSPDFIQTDNILLLKQLLSN